MRAEAIDPVVEFVARAAYRCLGATRVLLFGSRARGTHQRHSDFDVAIDGVGFKSNAPEWLAFLAYLDEAAPTLGKLDIINLTDSIAQDFRDEIERTSVYLAEGDLRD